MAHLTTHYIYSTCLGMSGNRKNSHELVQAQINVPSVILDLLFLSRVCELYTEISE